ncbi:MAG: nitroreductase family protein [Eubacteriales bacterium]|nr:nitroreductase family protein [Eubacteriales bacterium]
MNFLELAAARWSVRKFEQRPVEPEALEQILRAGQLAPTACNLQPQRVLVITGEVALARLRKCTKCHFDAPAALLVCYDKDECWKREYDGKSSGDIDASIVTTHMMLAAASLGVGSTWVMYFIPEAVREEFSIPDHLEPTALLVLGYPAPDAKPAPGHAARRPLEETTVRDSF